MALDDRQLSGLLQATLDFASQLLEQEGGFLPFGARVRPDGEVEFMQIPADGGTDLEAIYQHIGGALAQEARAGSILGAALVANTRVHGVSDVGPETALLVMIEAPGFARSITVPYRLIPGGEGPGAVELGAMLPEESDAFLFPALN